MVWQSQKVDKQASKRWTNEAIKQTKERTDGRASERTTEWSNNWANERASRRMNEPVNQPFALPLFLSFSPQIVVARLDGSLEFLSLGVPCRPSLNAPLLESSPIKRSSPRISRKSNIHTNAVPGAMHAEDSAPISVNGSHAYTSQESPLCRISHKLRAHHKPICALGVMEGRVITGSLDRTLKVNWRCVVLRT